MEKGYVTTRNVYKDRGYLAASKEAVDEFGSKEEALKKHDLLFGRISKTDSRDYLYTTAPEGREDEPERVIVDLWYMGYLFMKYGAGIWHIFNGIKNNSNFEILNQSPMIDIERFFIYDNKLDKKYRNISRMLMRCLHRKEKK